MRKALSIVLISLFGITASAQTAAEKKADKVDLDNIKRLYDRLKNYDIDTKTVLIWEYSYQDATEESLKKLSEAFEKGDLKFKEIVPTKNSKTFTLTVTEQKKYSDPKELHQRVKHLNEVAQVYKISMPYATIGAERAEKEEDIGKYKKVGIGKQAKKE